MDRRYTAAEERALAKTHYVVEVNVIRVDQSVANGRVDTKLVHFVATKPSQQRAIALTLSQLQLIADEAAKEAEEEAQRANIALPRL